MISEISEIGWLRRLAGTARLAVLALPALPALIFQLDVCSPQVERRAPGARRTCLVVKIGADTAVSEPLKDPDEDTISMSPLVIIKSRFVIRARLTKLA